MRLNLDEKIFIVWSDNLMGCYGEIEIFDEVDKAENKLVEIKSINGASIDLIVKGKSLKINPVEVVKKIKLEEKKFSSISIRAWSIIELKKCGEKWIILEFDHDREIAKLAKWDSLEINSNVISCVAPKLKPEMKISISELDNCSIVFSW